MRAPRSDDSLAFKAYDPDLVVLGKRMEDWLRISVAYWHSFAWDGRDMFGSGPSTARGTTAGWIRWTPPG